MWPSIILIVLLFTVFITLLFAFLQDIMIVLVNGVIIYLVGLKFTLEIKKRWEDYAGSLILSALMLFSLNNIFPLWPITTLILQAFILAQVIKLFRKAAFKKKR